MEQEGSYCTFLYVLSKNFTLLRGEPTRAR